jgi:predicted O-linked N-acetylglucosamine transferase (SPINDLY family)
LSDLQLASQIKNDGIDILIDLSGHTKGSRLTAFALRPAPVLISWLGYFATTGLPCMDALLLDAGHVTQDTPEYFTENILQLNPCRFYY